ncbi:MAG: transcriptional regulator, partial [Candidatus Brocadiales bacterium]|nr:transcriptional regulator [Candidatus Brocadiales bacterium]
HGWTEPMVWSLALEGADDLARFREFDWGLRTWDYWEWGDFDKRFGDDWPGRIHTQLIAHILYFSTKQNDLIFDPMAGGGVTPDTCLALGRRCWSLDMEDRPDTRPEIEPYYWDIKSKVWKSTISAAKDKPDLIIIDPPYFNKKEWTKQKYLEFIERMLAYMKENSKKSTRLALINADWRNFQNTPAADENPEKSILINAYSKILDKSGWERTHIIQAPMSSDRFDVDAVSAMQKKRILGVTSRYVIICK